MKKQSLNLRSLMIALIFISAFKICAQTNTKQNQAVDSLSAVNTIEKLFEAMREKNSEAIRSLFTPTGQLVAIDQPRDGSGWSKTRVLTGDAFAKLISESKQPEFVERMSQPGVTVSGDLAVVTGRYTFYVGAKFSHCGTNTFNLVRTEQGWKIANAASTLELQCERDLKSIVIPNIEANPADVSTIEGVLKTFYEVVSGKPGAPRQWSRDKTLYAPDVRFVAMSLRDGKPVANLMNHSKYINSTNDFFVKEGFVEREIARTVRQFGNIAHVFSVYEWETTGEKKEKGRGVNSIELFNDGTRWWISSVSWDEERANNLIPKEFFKKSK